MFLGIEFLHGSYLGNILQDHKDASFIWFYLFTFFKTQCIRFHIDVFKSVVYIVKSKSGIRLLQTDTFTTTVKIWNTVLPVL